MRFYDYIGEVECLLENQIKSELENTRVCDSTRKHSHDEVAKISGCIYTRAAITRT